jgi:hypothetical protein
LGNKPATSVANLAVGPACLRSHLGAFRPTCPARSRPQPADLRDAARAANLLKSRCRNTSSGTAENAYLSLREPVVFCAEGHPADVIRPRDVLSEPVLENGASYLSASCSSRIWLRFRYSGSFMASFAATA